MTAFKIGTQVDEVRICLDINSSIEAHPDTLRLKKHVNHVPHFLNHHHFQLIMTTSNMMAVDKTAYIKILERHPTYQHILLRPPGWGKSTFLQMLANYYDINKAEKFEEMFGQLSIGKDSNAGQNSASYLRESFYKVLGMSLRKFVAKNAAALGNPSLRSIKGSNGQPSLQAVLVSTGQAHSRHSMPLIGLFRIL
jgi:hypothetical protein